MEGYSQLALSPLLRKSPSSGFSVRPVFSHILWISDMHSLGFRRKKSLPCRIVRLCWFQSHRFCRFWLLMAENAYMLGKKKKKKVTTISAELPSSHPWWQCLTHQLWIVCLTACVQRKLTNTQPFKYEEQTSSSDGMPVVLKSIPLGEILP